MIQDDLSFMFCYVVRLRSRVNAQFLGFVLAFWPGAAADIYI